MQQQQQQWQQFSPFHDHQNKYPINTYNQDNTANPSRYSMNTSSIKKYPTNKYKQPYVSHHVGNNPSLSQQIMISQVNDIKHQLHFDNKHDYVDFVIEKDFNKENLSSIENRVCQKGILKKDVRSYENSFNKNKDKGKNKGKSIAGKCKNKKINKQHIFTLNDDYNNSQDEEDQVNYYQEEEEKEKYNLQQIKKYKQLEQKYRKNQNIQNIKSNNRQFNNNNNNYDPTNDLIKQHENALRNVTSQTIQFVRSSLPADNLNHQLQKSNIHNNNNNVSFSSSLCKLNQIKQKKRKRINSTKIKRKINNEDNILQQQEQEQNRRRISTPCNKSNFVMNSKTKNNNKKKMIQQQYILNKKQIQEQLEMYKTLCKTLRKNNQELESGILKNKQKNYKFQSEINDLKDKIKKLYDYCIEKNKSSKKMNAHLDMFLKTGKDSRLELGSGSGPGSGLASGSGSGSGPGSMIKAKPKTYLMAKTKKTSTSTTFDLGSHPNTYLKDSKATRTCSRTHNNATSSIVSNSNTVPIKGDSRKSIKNKKSKLNALSSTDYQKFQYNQPIQQSDDIDTKQNRCQPASSALSALSKSSPPLLSSEQYKQFFEIFLKSINLFHDDSNNLNTQLLKKSNTLQWAKQQWLLIVQYLIKKGYPSQKKNEKIRKSNRY